MATYNFRKHLERQRRMQGGGLSMNSRRKTWIGFAAVVLLLVVSLGFAVPEAWQKVGLAGLSSEGYRLGLDLQGGTHLVYEADMSQIPSEDRGEALQGVRDVIERRVNAFGVSEPVVQTIQTGGAHRVVVELAGVLDVNEAIDQIGETPILEFKEPGEDRSQLTPEETARLDEAQKADRAKAQETLDAARANGAFAADVSTTTITKATPQHRLYGPLVSKIVTDGIRPGRFFSEETPAGIVVVRYDTKSQETEWLLSQIVICFEGKIGCASNAIPQIEATIRGQQALEGITAENFTERVLQFSTDEGGKQSGGDLSWVQPGVLPPALELAVRELPVGSVTSTVLESDFGYHIFLKRDEKPVAAYDMTAVVFPLTTAADIAPDAGAWVNTPLSGKQLKRAVVAFDQSGAGAPFVSLTFDAEGGKLFGDLTSRLVRQPIGIFLDGALISAPIVQEPIYGGQAQITGNFTIDEAKQLAQRLNAGALPVPISLLSQQTVGPTLGQDSLNRSLLAGLIGFALVALFMILYYRLPGVISVAALALYALLNLSAYKLFDVTMTLAGIAGFILSIGMAVDANVLIFERLKEELKSGRDLPRAIEQGFARAWTSIRDGNVTTLIAAAILFFFSTSFIKGFAITLSIGVLLSMFSAIVITRTLLKLVSAWRIFNHSWLYNVRKPSQDL